MKMIISDLNVYVRNTESFLFALRQILLTFELKSNEDVNIRPKCLWPRDYFKYVHFVFERFYSTISEIWFKMLELSKFLNMYILYLIGLYLLSQLTEVVPHSQIGLTQVSRSYHLARLRLIQDCLTPTSPINLKGIFHIFFLTLSYVIWKTLFLIDCSCVVVE